MKYNPDTNRCRGVDPRLLGQMLSADVPINADYINTQECGCNRGTARTSNRYSRQSASQNNSGSNCCENHGTPCHDNDHIDDARLGSACYGSPSLAMAFSPFQHFHNLYTTEEALRRGTLFYELDKPWKAGGCR